MGLGRSKHKPEKGEKQKKGHDYLGQKSKEKSVDRQSQDSEKPLDTTPAEGCSREKGAAAQPCSAAGVKEKPEAQVKPIQEKAVLPQIIITRASSEAFSDGSIGTVEQRTIQEQPERGPYARHRNPSTVDAYALHSDK
ncbi:spermatogenesis-associated protein 33 [Pteronotus mesoamericanus]|uniref:spermatogenesis-associated protein 33 n=1 Tax=Pteronotus mesoamericanus TaxID=1884717 RepID=UPI0023EBD314|nr:spermatogenesis-associated protein 33 [Pteronotus parnellii mesoamericanus]